MKETKWRLFHARFGGRSRMRPAVVSAFAVLAIAFLGAPALAVDIDLSGASSASLIVAPGGGFASIFDGQSLDGASGVSGAPTNPLALQAASTLEVVAFDPGVSPAGNSILPPPSNLGPLSLLLDATADAITWTMGSASPPSSITVDFFDASGGLVHSVVQALASDYQVYTFSGFGGFDGLTIKDNTDPAGLRFMNFSYSPIVPEPATAVLFVLAVLGVGALKSRRR